MPTVPTSRKPFSSESSSWARETARVERHRPCNLLVTKILCPGRKKNAMSATSGLSAEDAVHDVMARLREAWERGDGEAYGSLFSEDAQYVTAPGERMHGRKSIAGSHQKIFDTFFKKTKLGRNYPSVLRQITSDVFLVESAGSVLFPGETEHKVAPNGLLTLVVARQ